MIPPEEGAIPGRANPPDGQEEVSPAMSAHDDSPIISKFMKAEEEAGFPYFVLL